VPREVSLDALLSERERQIDGLLDICARAAKRAREDLQHLESALAQADRALITAIEGAFLRGSLDAVGQILGLTDVHLGRFDEMVSRERTRLQERLLLLKAPEQDPAVLDLLHQEAQTHANALRPSVQRLRHDAEFQELLRSGYDPVNGPWWAFSYMKARRRADDVVERHGAALGVLDFASLLARHQEERHALETLDEDIATLNRARLAARHGHKERKDLEAAIDDVAGSVRGQLLGRVLSALDARPEGDRRSLAAVLPFGHALVVVDGMRAKRRYVQAALAHHVERTARALTNRRADAGELRRAPSSYIDDGRVEVETRAIVDDTMREIAVFDETVRRVLAFDDWARAAAEPHAIFFELFVNGAVDGAYLDEVVWQRTTRSATPTSGARVATWTENAAGAAERLAAIWDTVRDAAPSAEPPAEPSSSVPAPITFDDDPNES
jgi:hypothetical protein